MAAKKKITKSKARKKEAGDKRDQSGSISEKCSFCGKNKKDVKHLIKGQSGFICDSCTETCADVIHNLQKKDKADNSPGDKTSLKYIHQLVRRHFAPTHTSELITTTREFPLRMRVDLQRILNELLGHYYSTNNFTGIHSGYSHEGINFAGLLQEGQYAATIAPARFDEIEIGEDDPARCLRNGLWIGEEDNTKFALLLDLKRDFMGSDSVHIEVVVPPGETSNQITRRFFNELEKGVNEASAYRGKVISLEREHPYSGKSTEILVHKLPEVTREDIILPKRTLELLDRSIVEFSHLKSEFLKFRLSIKKGVLFYGPPGTGKTHSVKYLASALEKHTTLLVAADQIGYLSEYMLLARLLQPSIVVIEDVDLIAKARDTMNDTNVETLLNKLLNEMDGLKENNDVLFILTTNRPEVLEEALAERPGRVDQAIEFPLPDAESRKRLAKLYSRDLVVPPPLYDLLVEKTEGVSPAFIKELMRRIAQYMIIDKAIDTVTETHLNSALEDMLFASGKLNLSVLGGKS